MRALTATLLPAAALAAFQGDMKFPDFGDLKLPEMPKFDDLMKNPANGLKLDGLKLDGFFGQKGDVLGKKDDAVCIKGEDYLDVEKVLISDPATVFPNSTIEWKVTITNEREAAGKGTKGYPAYVITAKDSINGTTDISICDSNQPAGCESNSDTMSECGLAKLADGDNWMFVVKATVTAEVGESVCNTITVDSKCSDPKTVEVCTPVICPPDNLGITKEGPSGTIILEGGSVLPYTVTVTNAGADNAATMLEVTDTIPAGFEYNEDATCNIPCECNLVSTNLVCTTDLLPPDFVWTIDYTISPTDALLNGSPGTIDVDNTATVVSFCNQDGVSDTFTTDVCIPGTITPTMEGEAFLGGPGGQFPTVPGTSNAFTVEYTATFTDGPGASVAFDSVVTTPMEQCTLESLNQVSLTVVIVTFNCLASTTEVTPAFSVTRSPSAPLEIATLSVEAIVTEVPGDSCSTGMAMAELSISGGGPPPDGCPTAFEFNLLSVGICSELTSPIESTEVDCDEDFDVMLANGEQTVTTKGRYQVGWFAPTVAGQTSTVQLSIVDTGLAPFANFDTNSIVVVYSNDGGASDQQVLTPATACPEITDTQITCVVDVAPSTNPVLAVYANVIIQQEAVPVDGSSLCQSDEGLSIIARSFENCSESENEEEDCVDVIGPTTPPPPPECIWVLNDNGNAACQGVCQSARLFSNGCQGGTGNLALECDNSCAAAAQPMLNDADAMETIMEGLVNTPYCNVNDDDAPPDMKTDFGGVCAAGDSAYFPENGNANSNNIIAPAVAFDGNSNSGDVKGCLFVGPSPEATSTCQPGAGLGNISDENQGDNGAMIDSNDGIARLCCCILASTPGQNNQKCAAP